MKTDQVNMNSLCDSYQDTNVYISVVGIYNPAFDKTRRKIAERRMLTLREVGERTAAARDLKGFWSQVIKGLEFNGMIPVMHSFTFES